jgi:hypothetical protein
MTDIVAVESHRQSLESNLTMGIVFIAQLDVDIEAHSRVLKIAIPNSLPTSTSHSHRTNAADQRPSPATAPYRGGHISNSMALVG